MSDTTSTTAEDQAAQDRAEYEKAQAQRELNSNRVTDGFSH
ncbi:hypothetical protein P1P68_02245 [Streptomyces scabiei]|nr:hypothetical protein [Streptomyces scabiei]MDW8803655.1 hypothetical protein [Streptomyces scabiei]